MIDFSQITFGNSIVPLISAIVGGAVSSLLAHSRFKKEWWWQKKADVYSKLIYALHESKQFSETHWDATITQKELGETVEAELRLKARQSGEQIAQIRDTGIFFLDDGAIARLRKFAEDRALASNTNSWDEHLELDLYATSSCLIDIIEIAKRDLNNTLLGRLKHFRSLRISRSLR